MPPHISSLAKNVPSASSKEQNAMGAGSDGEFKRGRQAVQLALRFFFRWLLTVAICACFAGTVVGFAEKAFQLTMDKHNYNALTSGLIICLSLNLNSSLNSFARAWKWRLLSHRVHAPEVFQYLLIFDTSQLNSVRLLISAHASLWLRFFCIVWLLVNIGAQVATASVGLTYSMDSQVRTSVIPSELGDATTTLFTTIRNDGELSPNVEPPETPGNLTAQRGFAYAYGIGAVNEGYDAFIPGKLNTLGSVAFDSNTDRYVKNITDYSPWQPPNFTQTLDDTFFVVSERYVTNTAICDELKILTAQSAAGLTQVSFDGPSGAQNFSFQGGTDAVMAYISDTEASCGPRCTQTYGFLTLNNTQTLFRCNSTVSPILFTSNDQPVTRPELQLPDEQARILAGAVAWGGIQVSATLNGTDMGLDRFQAATYGNVSAFAPTYPTIDTGSMAIGYVALFPAIVLDVMDRTAPRVQLPNIAARIDASDLHVQWDLIELILGLIVGLQALLAIITVLAVYFYRVVIRDDAPFAVAPMLAQQVTHISPVSLQSGKEIAKTISGELRVAKADEAQGIRVVQTNVWDGTGPSATATGNSHQASPFSVAGLRPNRASLAAKDGVRSDTIGVPYHHHSTPGSPPARSAL